MKRVGLLAATLALALLGSHARADNDPALIKQAAASAGGQIVLQSALFDALHKRISDAFNKTYGPQGLNLKIVRIQTGPQAALYDQELRAGKVSGDLMLMADPGLYLKFKREGKFTKHCSANYKDFREQAVNPECSHFTLFTYLQYIGYNPEIISAGDVPKSWNDLLDPRWKGKVMIADPKIGGGHYYFVFTIGKLFGLQWFEKLRANGVALGASHGTVHNQTLSGERALGVNLSILVRTDGPYPGGKGGPVKEVFPAEGGALIAADVAITKDGPNTAGAKVFIDWASSLEGQKVIAQLGHFSLRKDFTSVEGISLDQFKYHIWDPVEMDQKRDEWTTEAIRILAGK